MCALSFKMKNTIACFQRQGKLHRDLVVYQTADTNQQLESNNLAGKTFGICDTIEGDLHFADEDLAKRALKKLGDKCGVDKQNVDDWFTAKPEKEEYLKMYFKFLKD
jgi:hypothetical protein